MKNLTQIFSTSKISFLFTLLMSLTFITGNVSAASLFSGAKKEACAGSQLTASSGSDCTEDDSRELSQTIEKGIDLVSIIVGIMAVIMLIIGGIRLIVSNGDSGKVTSGRDTIIYALAGLILVAFAQTIVKFVLLRI